MGDRRQKAISRSVQRALTRPGRARISFIQRILAFFRIFYLTLIRHEGELFHKLRTEVWSLDEGDYTSSFRGSKKDPALLSMGDLGFSGSTFFRTSNNAYLIKSVPRHFEHTFFREDLLNPYYEFMHNHPESLLVWITDYIYAPYKSLGSLLRTSPAHHIVMENMLYGKDDPETYSDAGSNLSDKWETYDLKPIDYFYPERDLVPDPLVSQETMSRLADKFEDKIRLTRKNHDAVKRVLERDTAFLASANIVDYSLFLVRFPAAAKPGTLGRKTQWRVGVTSADGKWKYRAVVLDFFWAKHTFHAQAMTGAVQAFNILGRQGPMSITTTAEEYREKFLEMVGSMLEVYIPGSGSEEEQ
ncbi:phosphatidylinositol phosphate kinase family protein [Aspergillus stella-maris]|uniref:phosphatidylinositol phosphate kinase family protein n=1 Tax=Aspergillus stella-maris TaxID=1810926 RepID=UPI003CCD6AF3